MRESDTPVKAQAEDPLYWLAVQTVLDTGRPSISLLMRTFCIGYSRAERLILAMEGKIIADGERQRFTAHLQGNEARTFALKRIPSAG